MSMAEGVSGNSMRTLGAGDKGKGEGRETGNCGLFFNQPETCLHSLASSKVNDHCHWTVR